MEPLLQSLLSALVLLAMLAVIIANFRIGKRRKRRRLPTESGESPPKNRKRRRYWRPRDEL